MSVFGETSVATVARRFAAGEPVLTRGDDQVGAFVAMSAADVEAGTLRQLADLTGDVAVLALGDEVADRLGLMSSAATIDAMGCRDGGWSLADRALTMRLASSLDTRRSDLVSPGHVSVLRVGSSEGSGLAAVLELARATGEPAAAVICPVLDHGGEPVSLEAARRGRQLRSLPVVPDVELHSLALARRLDLEAAACELPTPVGTFAATGFAAGIDGEVTLALVHGNPAGVPGAPVHLHTACLFGDVFRSSLCGCRTRLVGAIAGITDAGAGAILYTKPGVGDPFSCPSEQAIDSSVAAGLLRHLGIGSLTLTGGNLRLIRDLAGQGFELGAVGRVAA